MCCNRINTDVMMANLFAMRNTDFSLNDLEECLQFLSDHSPAYLISDFSEQTVRECVKEYPELFRISQDNSCGLIVRSGKKRPNLNYFNSAYSKEMSEYIVNFTKKFAEKKNSATVPDSTSYSPIISE